MLKINLIHFISTLTCTIALYSFQAIASVELYHEDFNSYQADITDDSSLLAKQDTRLDVHCGPDNSACLGVTYKPANNGSARLTDSRVFNATNEATLQFDVRFGDAFEFVKGGKLHGLGPAKPTTGCRPQVDDGWSVRVMWRKDGYAELYVYDQSRKQHNKTCGWSYRTTQPVFKPGQYHTVSIYVKTNRVGHKDGVAQLWVDGEHVASASDLELRGQDVDTLISRFMFSTFYGGNNPSWAPSKDNGANFDNFIVVKGKAIRKSAI